MAVFRQRGIIGRRDYLSSAVLGIYERRRVHPINCPQGDGSGSFNAGPRAHLLASQFLLLVARLFSKDACLDGRFLDGVIARHFKERA